MTASWELPSTVWAGMDFPTEGLPLPSCSSSSQTQLSTLSGMVPYWAGATSWCSGIAVPLLSSHLNTRKSNHHWFKKKKKKSLVCTGCKWYRTSIFAGTFYGFDLTKAEDRARGISIWDSRLQLVWINDLNSGILFVYIHVAPTKVNSSDCVSRL